MQIFSFIFMFSGIVGAASAEGGGFVLVDAEWTHDGMSSADDEIELRLVNGYFSRFSSTPA